MQKLQVKFFLFSSIFVLVFSFFSATTVFADDDTPPPLTEEVTTPIDEPVMDESTSALTDELAVVQLVIDQLPADTTVVVLDANGESIPLVAQDAANIFMEGDPMWCPSGHMPGDAECTSSQYSLTDLINLLIADGGATYSGAGTIYISHDYIANNVNATQTDEDQNIIFNYDDFSLTDLVVQGGWDFASNKKTGTSNLTGINSLNFINWENSLTLNNIVLSGAGSAGATSNGSGISINTWRSNGSLDVVLNNVTVTNTEASEDDMGMRMVDATNIYVAIGSVTITNSQFNEATRVGLSVSRVSGGNITLDNVTANNNDSAGALIYTFGDAIVDIADSEFNSNGEAGVYLFGGAVITLTNVTASDNAQDGFNAHQNGSEFNDFNVTITCSTFENNGGYGVVSFQNSTLTLNGLTFDNNTSGEISFGGGGSLVANAGSCETTSPTGSIKQAYRIIEQTQEQLPATLSNGKVFVSALQLIFTGDNAPEAITLSFPIPDGMENAALAVMYWNGSEWVEVPGGNVIDGKFVITVTSPGYYVLVSK